MGPGEWSEGCVIVEESSDKEAHLSPGRSPRLELALWLGGGGPWARECVSGASG